MYIRPTFDTIVRIGAGQQGRISHAQLLAAGVDRDPIKRWRADGRLHPVHVGVYAIGHVAPSLLGDLRAAVLAGGAGAVVSHRSAAHALRILPSRPPRVEITVPALGGRARPGLVIHRVKALHPNDTTTISAIAISAPERVLLDLAPRLSPAELTRACHEAWIHHDTTPGDVEACIARNPKKKGARTLRRALGSDVVVSDLGSGFLKLLRAPRAATPAHERRRAATRSTATGSTTA